MGSKNVTLYRRWLVSLIVVVLAGVAGRVAVSDPSASRGEGAFGAVSLEERASQERASQRPATQVANSAKHSAKQEAALPLWTSTRNQTARENAEAHWVKHRREFPEFRSAQEYIDGAHRFLRGPPEGTLFKFRENGDRLLYHPGTNTFAVQAKSGAPRTMFRPRNGRQYWNRQ